VPVFAAGNTNAGTVAGTAITRLLALRKALADIAELFGWLAAQADADLNGIGMAEADVTLLRSAMADAHELSVLYNGGALGSYTLPYNFSASQALIIGPQ
jgi:hypothetical protein